MSVLEKKSIIFGFSELVTRLIAYEFLYLITIRFFITTFFATNIEAITIKVRHHVIKLIVELSLILSSFLQQSVSKIDPIL